MGITVIETNKIKLGFDLTWFPKYKTGAAFYAERLISKIYEKYNDKIEIHLFVNKYSNMAFNSYIEIKLHYVMGPLKLWQFFAQFYLNKMINRVQLDIIHFPYYAYFGKINAKIIITILDLYYMYDKNCLPNKRSIFYWVHIFIKNIKKADLVVPISENTKKDIINFVPSINKSKISVQYPIVDDSYMPIPDLNRSKEIINKFNFHHPFLLSIGDSTVKRRNIIQLIIGYKRAVDLGYNLDLVLVGTINDKEIKDLTNEYGLENKVRILGYTDEDDLVLLHQCAKYCIVPSLYEGFSYPVVQSVKCGVPVIISNNSCFHEVAGKAGLYIERPFNNRKITETLMRSNDEKLYLTLKENCKVQREKFNTDILIAGYFNMYRDLIN